MKFDIIKLNECYSDLGYTEIAKLPKLARKLVESIEMPETSIFHIHSQGKIELSEFNKKLSEVYGFNNLGSRLSEFPIKSGSDTGYYITRMTVTKNPSSRLGWVINPIRGEFFELYIPTTKLKGKEVIVNPEPKEKSYTVIGLNHDGVQYFIKFKSDNTKSVSRVDGKPTTANFSIKTKKLRKISYNKDTKNFSIIDL